MNAQPSSDTVLIACPHCHALVRTPESRLQDNPTCARCKQPVLSGKPVNLDAAAFATHANNASYPVLVDFWAPWCGPCRAMAPVLDRVASELGTRVQVGKVNTDENQEIAERFGIRSIPTLILFRGGQEIARRSGSGDFGSTARWIEESLAK
jgi:thioredoxin 2